MKREILKPGKLFPPADLRRDEFDADNERLLMAEEAVDIVFIGDSITELGCPAGVWGSGKHGQPGDQR